jgi:predicted lipid-binding transport protein (Tim44 family)
LFSLWKVEIENLKKNRERDVLEEPSLNNLRIVDVQNFADDARDEFTVCIDASGRNVRYRDGVVAGGGVESFREFWTFQKRTTVDS